jgi:hypothetical protein
VLDLSTKIYPKALGLAATLDPRILFIILIIILNLHNLSLSESGCNTGSRALDVSLAVKSYHKSVIIK